MTPPAPAGPGQEPLRACRVALVNYPLFAVFDLSSWSSWLADGGDARLYLTKNGDGGHYVRARRNGRMVTLAREIAAAPADKIVRHANFDILDFRQSNLVLEDRSTFRRRPAPGSWAVMELAA